MYDLLQALEQEERDSFSTLHMTANENILSKTAQYLLSSRLSYRYYSDTYEDDNKPFNQKYYTMGNAIYRGLPAVYAFEDQARHRANAMFEAEFSDFTPLSGMHAVICIITSQTKPGDTIFVFSPQSVGHHATHALLNNLGRRPVVIPWDNEKMTVDLEAFTKVFYKEKPSMIFLDLGRPFYPLPIEEIRFIVGEGTKIVYDASHVLGLIAGGQFQNPLREGCDMLIGNTHKTFPGPQKAILLYADYEVGRKTGAELFGSAISSQHTHHSLALYATIFEMSVHGKDYAEQIIANARAFSRSLLSYGFELVSRKGEMPKSHIVAIRGPFPKGAIHACQQLHLFGISTNTQNIFGNLCMRIGVQELTRRGMKEPEMEEIALFFQRIIFGEVSNLVEEVSAFNARYHEIFYTLDEHGYLCRT